MARWTQNDVDNYQALMTRALVATGQLKPKRPKYGNRKVTDAEGNVHDSGKEYRRWQVLELRERAGEIRSLRRQVPYALVHDGVLVCRYVADFVYTEGEATIVEDVKSPATRKLEAYRIKKNLMKAIHKLEVREV